MKYTKNFTVFKDSARFFFTVIKHKFLWLMIWTIVFGMFCSGCKSDVSTLLKSQKVSDQEISDYLNDAYFLDHSLTLSEIKDVSEYPQETDNKMMLTCTTVASNEDVEQTANWELDFELFNGTWIGTDLDLGLNETVLVRDLTEETFAAAVCPVYHNYNYISIQRIDTDREAKTATAYCTMYTNGGAYYIGQDVQFSLEYRDQNGFMEWVYQQAPIVKERIGDYSVVITSEIEGHYEIEAPGSYYAAFDIKQDGNGSNLFALKNFSAQVHNYNGWEEFAAEDTPFSFRGSDEHSDGWWSGMGACLATKVELSNTVSATSRDTMQMTFQISNGSLYASHGYENMHELKSNLNSIFPFDQPYWQGTMSN